MSNNHVVICAGHNEVAKGAVNKRHNLNEYDESVVIMEWIGDLLKEQGIKATTMRGTLKDKVEFINEVKPTLALELHFNADADHLDPDDLDDSRGTGCMVLYCPQKGTYGEAEDPDYLRMVQASVMSKKMSNLLGLHNLGARQGWYWGSNPPSKKDYFLRKTSCPAFITEVGYIDNNKFCETWLLSNQHGRLAEGIVGAIMLHLATI